MARIWSCGFELQSVASGMEWDTTVGSPAINTTTVRSGLASLRCNTTAAAAYLAHPLSATGATAAHVYLRAYVYVATLPSAKTMLLAWTDNTNFGYGVRLHPDGKLRIEASNDFQFSSFSSTALSTGTWYRIEIDYNDSTDVCTAYVNGTQVATLSSADTFGGDRVLFGSFDAVTTDLYFDDLAVNDATGTAQNGLPGAGSIAHLRPNAAGDNNGFATAVGGTAGTANNYTRVSETTPDDATSYNNTTATGTTTTDDFNVTDSATAGIASGSTVTLVQVGQRAGSSATTTASIVTRLKGQAAGTTTESSSIPVNTTTFQTHATAVPRAYKITAYTNPQGSVAWTTTALDSLQIGYRSNVSQTTQRRVTAIWALVEYVPAASEVHTTAGTAFATATATGVSAGVRSTARSALATATATGTSSTVRTTARPALATATARGTSTSVHTTARTASATATATGVSAGVRSTARSASATATARGTDTSVRTTTGRAGALAGATYTSSTDVTTAGTAFATATARGTSTTVRTTAGLARVDASARGTSSTVHATARSASALAGARGVSSAVRTTARTAFATATARATSSTIRITARTASAVASASGVSAVVIPPVKVLVDGVWASSTPRVLTDGVWAEAVPNVRTGRVWSPR